MNIERTDRSRGELAAKIKELSFAGIEAQLFLDTHPDSRAALSYYHDTVDELNRLVDEYTDMYGPLTAQRSSRGAWNWIDGPWPWQTDTDENTEGEG